VSILDKLFRQDGPRVELDLASLLECLRRAVPVLEKRTVEPEHLRAQLADRYRDAGLDPIDPERFDALCADLDPEGWRRLALAVSVLDLPEVQKALPLLLRERDVEWQVRAAFIEHARALPLLTLEVLRKGPLRLEEFARGWLARIGAAVRDEKPEQSREALARLDYARLLAEAERARDEAKARMEYLKKLQSEDDGRRYPRSKW
jgi:hypothetical protein